MTAKKRRTIGFSNILMEATIHPRGSNESPGLDLTWFPKSDDLSLPDSRWSGLRASGSASISFSLEEDGGWQYEVCGFDGYSKPTFDKKESIDAAITMACAELANKINEAWQGEYPVHLEGEKRRSKAEEAYKKVLTLQRQEKENQGEKR